MFKSNASGVFKEALWVKKGLFVPILASFPGALEWLASKRDALDLSQIFGAPTSMIGALLALAMVIILLFSYGAKLRRQIKGTRTELSKLRAAGVALRNDCISPFSDHRTWKEWEEKAFKWNNDVIEEIRKLNEADAEWFSVLDVVPQPRLDIHVTSPPKPWEVDRIKLYQMHDFRVMRLGEMIQNLWKD